VHGSKGIANGAGVEDVSRRQGPKSETATTLIKNRTKIANSKVRKLPTFLNH
jgi:hypothetical protein